MGFSDDDLSDIYDKTDGYCAYCGKKLAFVNYGKVGSRGAWEVDHSNPKCRGGTGYFRNLVPACIDCNREKGTRSGKSYRASWARSEQGENPDWGEIILGGIAAVGLAYVVASALGGQRHQVPYPDR
jgi:5-methylcytosine-specific restriction endonuclease McrA